jgi:excisionase family DNA binding protein
MSLKALAVYSGLSVRKLRQLIDRDAANALPAYRVDGRVLVRRSEFDDYIARYRVSGRPGVIAALKEIGL